MGGGKRGTGPRAFLSLLALAVLVLLAACDSPLDTGAHAAGVAILDANGQEVARFVYGGSVTGSLSVQRGQTRTFQVRVIDEDGAIRPVDGVQYSISDPVVVIALAANATIQGSDRIVLEGLGAFSTTLQFMLNHGSHAEFEARGIPLVVQP